MKYYISKDLLKEKKDIKEGEEKNYIEIEIHPEKKPDYKRVEVHKKV